MVLIFIIAGIAMLLGAAFFGYMLALLQRRVGTIVSSQNVSTQSSLFFPSIFVDFYTLWGRYFAAWGLCLLSILVVTIASCFCLMLLIMLSNRKVDPRNVCRLSLLWL